MSKVLIIAEAGVNHNGDIETAKKLAYVAKECGADLVKYQTIDLDAIVSNNAPMADYQKNNIGKSESQKEMLRKLVLSYDEFVELKNYCDEIGIKFLSTPFELKSVDFLEELGCEMWKIPSGEITNYPYLIKIARTGKPIIISTGMSTIEEIDECINLLRTNGATDITILQCNTQYPTDFIDANVKAMVTLKERYGTNVGYSDHTRGIIVPVMAVALGATVIEKHFTLDKNMEGPDHKASLEPSELKEMISAVRNAEEALGTGEKIPSASECKNKEVARKSIVAKKRIKKGELFTESNITTKRPGTGISPMKWNDIIGTASEYDFEEDDLIKI